MVCELLAGAVLVVDEILGGELALYGGLDTYPSVDVSCESLTLHGGPNGLTFVEVGIYSGLVVTDGVGAVHLLVVEAVIDDAVVVGMETCGHSVVVGEGVAWEAGHNL